MPAIYVREPAPVLLTTVELRATLRAAADAVGGLAAWARLHDVAEATVYTFNARPGPCPEVIAEALGYTRVTRYVAREVRP